MCGGTYAVGVVSLLAWGLSPRVRGNQMPKKLPPLPGRSIPACAGEPNTGPEPGKDGGVYPRVCGGTGTGPPRRRFRRGLSPRVRGNRTSSAAVRGERRSIPACAGEPRAIDATTRSSRVYPRVCGGTVTMTWAAGHDPGLSPRVRGNPSLRRRHHIFRRSIPACAGEPGRGLFPCRDK